MTASRPASGAFRTLPPEWLVLFVAGLIALVTACHAPIAAPLTDAFQEGEYLATYLQFAPALPLPLLIHGGMDYLPAQAVFALVGPDHLVTGVRLANALLGFVASLLFIACLRAIPATRCGRLVATVLGCALLLLVNGRIMGIVELQQGAPAIRDLGLLAELWLLLRAERASDGAARVLSALAGLVAGLALFWAYNRGIVGVLALGAWMAGAQARGWRPGAIAMPLLGLCSGVAICLAADPAMFAQHLANIAYWQQNQAIWAKRPDFLPEQIYAAEFVIGSLALFAGSALTLANVWRKGLNANGIANLLMLGAVAVLLAYGTLSRLDSFHIQFALPFELLLAFRLALSWCPAKWPAPTRAQGWIAAALAIWLIAVVQPVQLALGFADNLAMLSRGLPADRALADPPLAAAAGALRAGGGSCTYAFDNGGAIYHLANLPPCSATMVPVYAAAEREARVIAELSARRPPLVIAASDAWYAAIDGKPLAQRTPALQRWLNANYVPHSRAGGIELWRVK